MEPRASIKSLCDFANLTSRKNQHRRSSPKKFSPVGMFILFLSLILSQRGSGKQGWHGSDGWQSTVIKVIVSKLGYVPWYDVFLFKGYALHKNKVLTLQQHLSDESREIKFSKEIFQCWVWRWSVIPPQYQWLTTISNQIVGEIIYSNHK